ncbi:Protein ABHD17C [Porphyridium purpureum]|uniref:Protein ABHD17C n=1 Tax=Porphyridium purpureum TaxID=35688 RepID=A0A5J4Z5J9_PORPP|nr:Protein ABHD17C [Porphyridium purpureum]|eukprot:POR8519..scf295_1
MGGVVSSLLFQPPVEPTYELEPGTHFLKFRMPQQYLSTRLVDLPVVTVRTEKDDEIALAYIEHEAPLCTLLLSHGTSEDIGYTVQWAAELCGQLEVNVLVYDYTGYGVSAQNPPSEQRVYADAMAAYDYLVRVRNIPWQKIVLMGRSMGSGPATFLASTRSCAGLVLVCPLASAVRVVAPNLPSTPRFDMFANIDRVADIVCPVLILHGRDDEVVPFECAVALYEKLAECSQAIVHPPFWVNGAGHNNLETYHRPVIFNLYRSFILNWAMKDKHIEAVDAASLKRISCTPGTQESGSTAQDLPPAELRKDKAQLVSPLTSPRTRAWDLFLKESKIDRDEVIQNYSTQDMYLPDSVGRGTGKGHEHSSTIYSPRRIKKQWLHDLTSPTKPPVAPSSPNNNADLMRRESSTAGNGESLARRRSSITDMFSAMKSPRVSRKISIGSESGDILSESKSPFPGVRDDGITSGASPPAFSRSGVPETSGSNSATRNAATAPIVVKKTSSVRLGMERLLSPRTQISPPSNGEY